MELRIKPDELKAIMEQYEPNDSDTDGMRMIKERLQGLDEADRIIMLLYAELLSTRKLGAILGVSHTTVEKEIRNIREKLDLKSLHNSINL